jgi:hypothetical protein
MDAYRAIDHERADAVFRYIIVLFFQLRNLVRHTFLFAPSQPHYLNASLLSSQIPCACSYGISGYSGLTHRGYSLGYLVSERIIMHMSVFKQKQEWRRRNASDRSWVLITGTGVLSTFSLGGGPFVQFYFWMTLDEI